MSKCCCKRRGCGCGGFDGLDLGFNGCSLKCLAIFILVLNRFTDIDCGSLEFIIALFYLFCSPNFC